MTTVLDTLNELVATIPDAPLFTDGLTEESLTAVQTARAAVAAATLMLAEAADKAAPTAAEGRSAGGGDLGSARLALMLFCDVEPLDFVTAVLGASYAGMVVVPAPWAAPGRVGRFSEQERAAGIKLAAACLPEVVVCSQSQRVYVATALAAAGLQLPVVAISHVVPPEAASGGSFVPLQPHITGQSCCFVQFTSGSTMAPRGVVVTHSALMATTRLIGSEFGFERTKRSFTWLPLFHDMGLVGHVYAPIVCGLHSILLARSAFLNDPLVWVRLISKFQCSYSGGPDAAYAAVVRAAAATNFDASTVDLRCWDRAYSGSAVPRRETMRNFTRTFQPSGFRLPQFYPCYGLAEATLFVCGEAFDDTSVEIIIDDGVKRPLGSHLVSCGVPRGQLHALIVDEAGKPVPEDVVGEIVLAGATIATHYLQPRRVLTTIPFVDINGLRAVRSGDLGFFHDSRLYVIGRSGDVMSVAGRKVHATDVEEALRDLATRVVVCIVRGSDRTGGVDIMLVLLEKLPNIDASHLRPLAMAIESRIVREFGVRPASILFVKQRCIPMTTSGKPQRHACAKMVGTPSIEYAWPEAGVMFDQNLSPSVGIRRLVANTLRVLPSELDGDTPLYQLGLASLEASRLLYQLRARHGLQLSVATLLSSTVRQLEAGDIKGVAPEPMDISPLEAAVCHTVRTCGLDPVSLPSHGTVLLTGGGGFVGIHMLHFMLLHTTLDVVCLLRCADVVAGLERIWRMLDRYELLVTPAHQRRVSVVMGDVSQPHLGLVPHTYAHLARVCCGVIHCAARDNFVEPAIALWDVNVASVASVLTFAHSLKRKFVVYTSSCAAHLASRSKLPFDIGLANGYSKSKLAAESLCAAAATAGATVFAFRLGYLFDTSSADVDDVDTLEQLLRYCLKIGSIPELPDDLQVDLTAVTAAVASMWHLTADHLHAQDTPSATDTVRVWYNMAPARLAWLFQAVRSLAGEAGQRLEVVPWSSWLSIVLASEADCPPVLAALLVPELVDQVRTLFGTDVRPDAWFSAHQYAEFQPWTASRVQQYVDSILVVDDDDNDNE